MENHENFFDYFNVFKRCRRYGIGAWECPQFLFLVMGILIIAAILGTNAVARRFVDPSAVSFIVLGITAVLFVISYIVVASFEKIARSSRAKSEFISIMSHQLRTPLSGVKWQLSLIFDEQVNLSEEKRKSFLTEINAQNEEMIKIVNELLEINRIEDKSVTLMPSGFSIKELAKEIVPPGIFVFASDSLPDVFADKIRIKNILIHLIDNASRYGSGRGEISVRLKEIPGYVHCSVEDESGGISKDDAKKIFTKFFRSESAGRYKAGGMGIGLYIAKYIIEASGGKMGFITADGKGSTFWFTLPINKI